MPDPQTCGYAPCDCEVSSRDAIAREGATFCSARCADGYGCDHQGCNCGKFPTEEPETD